MADNIFNFVKELRLWDVSTNSVNQKQCSDVEGEVVAMAKVALIVEVVFPQGVEVAVLMTRV